MAPEDRGLRSHGSLNVAEAPLPWVLVAVAFGIAVYAFFFAPLMVGG